MFSSQSAPLSSTPPQPPSSSSNINSNNDAVIIFDWDDTILPSSFVDKCQVDNVNELPQHFRSLFREIEICTETCLAEAAKFGEVILITNSDEGWVKYSAERYLPNLIPILQNYRIISARTQYEKFYPNQPLCWKAAAFAHEVNEHFCSLEEAHSLLDRECSHAGITSIHNQIRQNVSVSDNSSQEDSSIPDMDVASTDESSLEEEEYEDHSSIESTTSPRESSISNSSWRESSKPSSSTTTITPPRRVGGGAGVVGGPSSSSIIRREVISFGDSIEERTAVKIVSDQLDALPKSVKFLHSPTPIQIIGQLTMLTHHMKFVCDHVEELDLEITARQAEKCANGYLTKRGMVMFPPGSTTRRMGSSMDPPAAGDANMDVSDL